MLDKIKKRIWGDLASEEEEPEERSEGDFILEAAEIMEEYGNINGEPIEGDEDQPLKDILAAQLLSHSDEQGRNRSRVKIKKTEIVETVREDSDIQLPILAGPPIYWEQALLLYESALEEVRAKISVLNREFKLKNGYSPIEHINTRIKQPESISNKMKKKKIPLLIENVVEHVSDIAGVRIICSYTSDIYSLAQMISNQADVTVLAIKDYIANPKPNGYQSYHMIVTVPVYLSDCVKQTKVEIQIRTSAMDFWASLEHKMNYKYAGQLPEHIKRELKECADIAAFLDRKMLALHEEILKNDEQKETDLQAAGVDIRVEKNIWQIF